MSMSACATLKLLPESGQYREHGNRGGFGAEDLLAERDGLPAGGSRGPAFGIGPPAFRAKENRQPVGGLPVRGQRGNDRRRLRFIEEVPEVRFHGERVVQPDCRKYFRHAHPPGLLAAFPGDADPALRAFARGFKEPFLAARGLHREDAVHPEFGRLLDDPLEPVELDQGRAKRDPDGRRRRRNRLQNPEHDPVGRGLYDLGDMRGPVVGNFVDLSGSGAQDARKVAGFIAAEFGCPGMDGIYKESSSGQESIL